MTAAGFGHLQTNMWHLDQDGESFFWCGIEWLGHLRQISQLPR